MTIPLPPRNGVVASAWQLPAGAWPTVLDGLCAQFTAIGRDEWRGRIERGLVCDALGVPITLATPYRVGLEVRYYREVANEARIPFAEGIVHVDAHFIVADKPHFLPVTPAGRHVEETLLARLMRRFDNPHLVPLHRIDRATAGLVLFSTQPATRARYQALFPERRIRKHYEALAPALPQQVFPQVRATRLVRGEPFFRMCEVAGGANSETRIDVLDRDGEIWRYALEPVTGKKHQLRVHMAALGAAIVNDGFYPVLAAVGKKPAGGRTVADLVPDDFGKPLKLLAKHLAFIDPLSGRQQQFESRLSV